MPPKKYTVPCPASAAGSTQPKQRQPMARPIGISDTEWWANVSGREAVTTDRRRRLYAKRARYAAAATAVNQEEASRAGMMSSLGRNPQAA
ncbi:hypothetical protein D1007_14067 [Hordeum vulgare]|nr:hypothetical protein D1007_14067 [Hordeum vulgare]